MASSSVDKGEDFLTQLESIRSELKAKFSRTYKLLKEKEEALLNQLKEIEELFLGENKNVSSEKRELLSMKEQLESNLKGNTNQDTLTAMLAPLEAKLKEFEANREEGLHRIELNWEREGELESILEVFCTIRFFKVIEDYDKSSPVLVACKCTVYPKEPGEFNYPTVLAIHTPTNNIYVCDESRSRIQVFNKECEFLHSFSERMNFPSGISFYGDKIYVTQFSGHALNVYSLKTNFIITVGKRGDKELQFSFPLGIEISQNRIYICDRNNNRVQILNIDLSFNRFLTQFDYPLDVKVVKEEIFILDKKNPCLHVYNFEHQLVREFISFGYLSYQVYNTSHFCIDSSSNILMTDRTACCVLVFSKDGKLIQKFGKKGDNAGEFQSPRGIAIDSQGRIVVVSSNPDNCIQFF